MRPLSIMNDMTTFDFIDIFENFYYERLHIGPEYLNSNQLIKSIINFSKFVFAFLIF